MTYQVCDHCTRTTGGTSVSILRVRGWRFFEGTSQTGKTLRKIVCPWCAGTATEPEPTGWSVGCDTCWWVYEPDEDEGPLTEKDARQIGDDHECEPDIWVKGPEATTPRPTREPVITGSLL